MADGFVVRRNGKLMPVAVGSGMKSVHLLDGEHMALIVTWGDVVTAYYSYGIPNITAYMTLPPGQARVLRSTGFLLQRLVQIGWVRRQAARLVEQFVTGPSEHLRQTGHMQLYAKVIGSGEQQAEAWLETPEAYQFTIQAAVNAVEHTFAAHPSGALTPAQAFGADFVLQVEGTIRRDRV